MAIGQKLVSRYLPPLILAGVVLLVFAVLQNSGPRSVIRRFHEAVYNKDATKLENLMADPSPRTSEAVSELVNAPYFLASQNYFPYRITVNDQQKEVFVAVDYLNKEFGAFKQIDYVLVRKNGQCKVDALKTLIYHSKWAAQKHP